jgi:hypothetical protein
MSSTGAPPRRPTAGGEGGRVAAETIQLLKEGAWCRERAEGREARAPLAGVGMPGESSRGAGPGEGMGSGAEEGGAAEGRPRLTGLTSQVAAGAAASPAPLLLQCPGCLFS